MNIAPSHFYFAKNSHVLENPPLLISSIYSRDGHHHHHLHDDDVHPSPHSSGYHRVYTKSPNCLHCIPSKASPLNFSCQSFPHHRHHLMIIMSANTLLYSCLIMTKYCIISMAIIIYTTTQSLNTELEV